MAEGPARLQGLVKWFRGGTPGKGNGYGFIVADPPLASDVFFHLKDIRGYFEGKVPETGLPGDVLVTFLLEDHEKGLRAKDVAELL
jgi:cold shock CspA family protein